MIKRIQSGVQTAPPSDSSPVTPPNVWVGGPNGKPAPPPLLVRAFKGRVRHFGKVPEGKINRFLFYFHMIHKLYSSVVNETRLQIRAKNDLPLLVNVRPR